MLLLLWITSALDIWRTSNFKSPVNTLIAFDMKYQPENLGLVFDVSLYIYIYLGSRGTEL